MTATELERISSLEAKQDAHHEDFLHLRQDIHEDMKSLRQDMRDGFKGLNESVKALEKKDAGSSVKVNLLWKVLVALLLIGLAAVVTTSCGGVPIVF